MRQYDQDLAVPYWDSTLDEGIPDPRESVLWTKGFLGNGNGKITTEPSTGWKIAEGWANDTFLLPREVGSSQFGDLYKQADIDFVLSSRHFENLTACVDPTFELAQALVHEFVGGHMTDCKFLDHF